MATYQLFISILIAILVQTTYAVPVSSGCVNGLSPNRYAFNAGGPSIATLNFGAEIAAYITSPSTETYFSTTQEIITSPKCRMGDLFKTERFSRGEKLSFKIPVPNSNSTIYTVTTMHAETFFDAPGKRKFHIEINGARLRTDLDVYTDANGKDKGIKLAHHNIRPKMGYLEIEFLKSIENPQVNAIIIEGKGAHSLIESTCAVTTKQGRGQATTVPYPSESSAPTEDTDTVGSASPESSPVSQVQDPSPLMAEEPMNSPEVEVVPQTQEEPVALMATNPSMSAAPEPSTSAQPVPSMSSAPEPSMSAQPVPSMSAAPEPSSSAQPVPSMSSAPVEEAPPSPSAQAESVSPSPSTIPETPSAAPAPLEQKKKVVAAPVAEATAPKKSSEGVCGSGGSFIFCEDFDDLTTGATVRPNSWVLEDAAKIGVSPANSKALHLTPGSSEKGRLIATGLNAGDVPVIYGRMSVYVTEFATKPYFAHFVMAEMWDSKSPGTEKVRPVGGQFVLNNTEEQSTWGIGSDGGPTGDWTQWKSSVRTQDAKWTCVEWVMDRADNSIEMWLDGVKKPQLSVNTDQHTGGHGKFILPRFDSAWFGWWVFQGDTRPSKFDVYIDDIALAKKRIGC